MSAQTVLPPEDVTGEQERLAAIGRLVAGVAHDFNNIVTVITLSAQILESQTGLDDVGREQVGHIRRAAGRASSMVWQILDFAHEGPISRVPVDLDLFFEELVPALRRTQPPKVAIHCRSDGADHRVLGDPGRLEQVFSNLVINANDAIPVTGEIEFRVARQDVVTAPDRSAWIRVDVSDTGTGMPPDVLARIFEPFFSTKPPGQGTGLGLAQVQALVSQHGGRVAATSTPGAGTTATVWLPALR